MKEPGPKAHIVRLVAVLGVAFVAFLIAKALLVPDSWDYENWYRGDALALNESYEVAYGGNDSCVECHQESVDELSQFKHQALSCESCHGALSDHAKDGVKIADAHVDDESRWQCLNCHEARVNKPKNFPQFDKIKITEHKEMDDEMLCIACHSPHDPTP